MIDMPFETQGPQFGAGDAFGSLLSGVLKGLLARKQQEFQFGQEQRAAQFQQERQLALEESRRRAEQEALVGERRREEEKKTGQIEKLAEFFRQYNAQHGTSFQPTGVADLDKAQAAAILGAHVSRTLPKPTAKPTTPRRNPAIEADRLFGAFEQTEERSVDPVFRAEVISAVEESGDASTTNIQRTIDQMGGIKFAEPTMEEVEQRIANNLAIIEQQGNLTENPQFNRAVAVKMLPEHMGGQGETDSGLASSNVKVEMASEDIINRQDFLSPRDAVLPTLDPRKLNDALVRMGREPIFDAGADPETGEPELVSVQQAVEAMFAQGIDILSANDILTAYENPDMKLRQAPGFMEWIRSQAEKPPIPTGPKF